MIWYQEFRLFFSFYFLFCKPHIEHSGIALHSPIRDTKSQKTKKMREKKKSFFALLSLPVSFALHPYWQMRKLNCYHLLLNIFFFSWNIFFSWISLPITTDHQHYCTQAMVKKCFQFYTFMIKFALNEKRTCSYSIPT